MYNFSYNGPWCKELLCCCKIDINAKDFILGLHWERFDLTIIVMPYKACAKPSLGFLSGWFLFVVNFWVGKGDVSLGPDMVMMHMLVQLLTMNICCEIFIAITTWVRFAGCTMPNLGPIIYLLLLFQAKRMDVVVGETAGVHGQLWLLCPILFTLQVMKTQLDN